MCICQAIGSFDKPSLGNSQYLMLLVLECDYKRDYKTTYDPSNPSMYTLLIFNFPLNGINMKYFPNSKTTSY